MPALAALLVGVALAVPPDHTVLTETDGCVLSIGSPPPEGPRTLRSECLWPEARLGPVRDLLTDYTAYPRIIPNIRAATVIRADGDRALVHQEHDIPLFADREVLLWMWNRDRDDGGFLVTWEKSDEPLEPAPGHSVVLHNSGRWEVWPAAGGGLHVVHEVAYDPGVRVPDWLVRRYRTTGMATVLRKVRERSTGAGAVP